LLICNISAPAVSVTVISSDNFQEHHVNVTAIRTGVPYDKASLAEPVVYNIGNSYEIQQYYPLLGQLSLLLYPLYIEFTIFFLID